MTLVDQLREAAYWHPHLGPLLIDAAQRIDAQARELRRAATGRRIPVTSEMVRRLASDLDHLTREP